MKVSAHNNFVRFFRAWRWRNARMPNAECRTPNRREAHFATTGQHGESAFTLIEIMVVVGIMAIILAAGIPSLYGFFHKQGLRKTVGDIVETCESARAAAILGGAPVDLVFHPKDGTCEATGGKTAGYGAWVHSAKIVDCTIEMLDVNLQECKDFDTVKIRFFPNGTCDEMTLVLRSNNNEWRKITTEITTGLVSVSDRIQ